MIQSPLTLSATSPSPSPTIRDMKKEIPINATKKTLPQLPSLYTLQQGPLKEKGKEKQQQSLNHHKEVEQQVEENERIESSSSSIHHRPLGSSSMSVHSIGSEQLLDHSHLKPGDNASLLSYSETINMYRMNAKKTNDMEIQCDFAIFLVEAAKRLTLDNDNHQDNNNDSHQHPSHSYILEAEKLLKQIATRGHAPSQYYLGNIYASGLLHKTNKFEFDKAFPFYVQAAKHHHPDAAYRTAKCYEDGLGTKRDKGKAVQYYRKAATLNHPGAMYRIGLAQMRGELGLSSNIRDGHKWLKRSAEASTQEYPHALHELAQLHERGVGSIIFSDHDYAIRLYQEASDLGYAPSCFRLGECYEFGRLGCTIDPRLSMYYYGLAAEQGHPHACFALTAWYLIGIPDVMEPSDQQAFMWALKAADMGLPKAEYAIGYFYEVGIGIEKDEQQSFLYYQKAADHDEKRAVERLKTFVLSSSNEQQQPVVTSSTPLSKKKKSFMQKRNSTPSLLNMDNDNNSNINNQQQQHQYRHSIQSPSPTSKQSTSNSWLKKWKNKMRK
ncbi:hypothetical protein BJ944DRAFT_273666 [Cunninghamella echinulata]|nr:hypothetical protein BJ944DRAFT_273666 [Cunninghamella echinulata]